MKRNSEINIFEKILKPSKTKSIEGFVRIGGNPNNIGFFVVPDNIINNNAENNTILIGNYSTDDEKIINYIENKMNDYSKKGTSIVSDTKLDVKESATGLSDIVTFISLYLGIIFLISSFAILALKELSDCLDDKNKYKILR